MSETTPERCDRCQAPLEGYRATSYREVAGKFVPVEHYCRDCQVEEDYQAFARDRTVSTKILIDLACGIYDPAEPASERLNLRRRPIRLEPDPAICEALVRFRDQLKIRTLEFEGSVWFDAGLQKFVQTHPGGLSARFRRWHGWEDRPIYTGFEMDVRGLGSTGRYLITFEAAKQWDPHDPAVGTSVTFITEEASRFHRMGVQGVSGCAKDVLALCDIAIHDWGQANRAPTMQAGETIDFGLAPDSQVSFL